jgi:hypothetical protein
MYDFFGVFVYGQTAFAKRPPFPFAKRAARSARFKPKTLRDANSWVAETRLDRPNGTVFASTVPSEGIKRPM